MPTRVQNLTDIGEGTMRQGVIMLGLATLFVLGCMPDRTDRQAELSGRPLTALMQRTGGQLETIQLPDGGEGRVLNELQKLWHYMSVSSSTHLVLFRSRYATPFNIRETVIARFDLPGVGTIDITAVDEDGDDDSKPVNGHLKFSTEVQSPSPGTAKGEVFPFLRHAGVDSLPPSLHMVLSPGFTVPTGSHLDPRKRYMRDETAIRVLQRLVLDLYAEGILRNPIAD
ncbi:MAG: hypothetical protein FJY97_14880 [candidate division Zixibacteria bacterium]|nr:hypothetical protein [candidate division Zixibacteria bacterium]